METDHDIIIAQNMSEDDLAHLLRRDNLNLRVCIMIDGVPLHQLARLLQAADLDNEHPEEVAQAVERAWRLAPDSGSPPRR